MIIISTIHTGRKIFTNIWLSIGVLSIILATFIRSFISFYEEYTKKPDRASAKVK
jgi:uncharacterized protein involved in response to NO